MELTSPGWALAGVPGRYINASANPAIKLRENNLFIIAPVLKLKAPAGPYAKP